MSFWQLPSVSSSASSSLCTVSNAPNSLFGRTRPSSTPTSLSNLARISWFEEREWGGGLGSWILHPPLVMSLPQVGRPKESLVLLPREPDQLQDPMWLLLHVTTGGDQKWICISRKKRLLLPRTLHLVGGLLGLREARHIQSVWGRIRMRGSSLSLGEILLILSEMCEEN